MEFEEVEVNSERWLDLKDFLNEEWRDVENYEGLYQISNYGRIKSFPRNGTIFKDKILKLRLNKTNYFTIVLSKNNKPIDKLVHRLVALAFIFTNDKSLQINHIDGNKQNNKVNNLEWCTCKQNVHHSIILGLKPNDKGINNVHSKFSEEEVMRIRKEYVKRSKEHGCRALAKKYNVSKSTISYIINKKTYK